MNLSQRMLLLGALLSGGVLFTANAHAQEGRGTVSSCGSVFATSNQLNEYRTGASDPDYHNVRRFHLEPALSRMRQGDFSAAVLDDLNFILRGWPNYHPALEALIQYDIGGGKTYNFLPTECYFSRAREFAPDDVKVLALEASWFWKKGKKTLARDIFREALELMPDSADLNYNMGLIYLETGEPRKALEHALKAYRAGYPLPGLRNRLIEAGIWKEDDAHEEQAAGAPR